MKTNPPTFVIKTFDKKKNKKIVAGTFYRHTFTKKVNTDHYMVIEKGYGIQEDVIQTLDELNCVRIQIETETKKFEYPFSLLLKRPIKDYGHGKQRFIPISEAKLLKRLNLFEAIYE